MTNSQNRSAGHSLKEAIEELQAWLESSDKILIGAGAGLSAAAGLSYLDEDLFRQFQPEMAAMGYRYPYELFQHEDEGWPQARNGLI